MMPYRKRYPPHSYRTPMRAVKRLKYATNTTLMRPPVARLSILRKGEVKYKDFTVTGTLAAATIVSSSDLTDITQGPAQSERIGDEIHILGFDMNGFLGTNGANVLGHFFLSPQNNTLPVATDFSASIGALPAPTDMRNWWHMYGGNNISNPNLIKASYRFRYPLKVHYASAAGTSGNRNRLFYTLVNRSGADVTGVQYFVRIYYQDS